MDLRELTVQLEELEGKIEEARARETGQALQEIKQKMALYGITANDLGVAQRKQNGHRQPVAAKYRDPRSGKTWSGRGKPPTWIAGKNRENFAI